MGVGQSRAAISLVRRVGERRDRSSLVGAMELRGHVGTASMLIGGRPEVWIRREGHLSLVSRLGKSASASGAVMGIAVRVPRTRISHVITHIAVSRLRGFASEVSGLGSVSEWSLGSWAHLWEKRKFR